MILPVKMANTIHNRKTAALSALKFFTDIKSIRSSYFSGSSAIEDARIIQEYRHNNPPSVIRSFADAARTGVGDCREYVSIVYASLHSNPRIYDNSAVMMCSLRHNYGVIVVTNKSCAKHGWRFNVSELSIDTMIVDAWHHDWYFPNVDTHTEHLYNLRREGSLTARQYDRRMECKNLSMQTYEMDLLADPQGDPY